MGDLPFFRLPRAADLWLPAYLRQARRRRTRPSGPVHLILCIADHYEPAWGDPPPAKALARVRRWVRRYPALFGRFADADGRPPQHTFFYPIDQYDAACVDALSGLCRDGYGEVEVQLHHEGETAEELAEVLAAGRDCLAVRHGLLARDRAGGRVRFGFVHGNWCLANSHPRGRHCGVNDELRILVEAGCYADFTMPSAPSRSQARRVNSLYYATGSPRRTRGHDRGVEVGRGPAPPGSLLLVQGPLILDRSRLKWGLLPRLETGSIQPSHEPHVGRVPNWLRARIQVPGRPDWYFVKLYGHGATGQVFLEEPMVRFHRDLAAWMRRDPDFRVHYVTAREMANLIRAAEAGWRGDVESARDFELVSPLRPALDPAGLGGTDDQPAMMPGRP